MKKIGLFLALTAMLALCACQPTQEHTHRYEEKVTAPTCTEDGYTTFTCECGDTYQGDTVAAGHREETLAAKDVTCTEDGLTEGKKCSACGEILVEQEAILAQGHQYGEWKVVKDSTLTEKGEKARACSACGDKQTKEIPMRDDPNAKEYTVTYDLGGGYFVGGYSSIEALGDAFLADFNKYGDGSVVTKDNFQNSSHPCVLTSLSNAEMLEKWNWLWVYMLDHLKEYNKDATSAYITDTYPVLEKMIRGDTSAIKDSSYARTSIRSYIHGFLNSMKGCGSVNPDFSKFSPDFSSTSAQQDFLRHQFNLTVTLANGEKLPIPVRDGYQFGGWENKFEEIITEAVCAGTLKAIWNEPNPVQNIEITNKVTEIGLYDTYQLEWKLTPADASNLQVRFESSDPSIASINEHGLITTHKTGKVTITIISLSQYGYTDRITVSVVTPGYFDISYETNSYVAIGDTIKLNAKYISKSNRTYGVEWKSLDESMATVDKNGFVLGKATGVVTIRATAKEHPDKYQDFVVTVLTEEISEGLELVLQAHESNVFIRHDLPVGSGTPSYYSDIFGSISRLLYNKELEINYEYNEKSNEKYGSSLKDRIMESIEFIVVHYTGNFKPGADAKAHGDWFAQPTSENNTSIHYSTGNDGIYKGLDEEYRAAHAGDDGSRNTVSKFSWIDTPVEVLDTDPEIPVVTITERATFAINGRDTGVKVPKETKYGRGYVTDSKWLNEQGIGVNIKDGMYQIGTSWWCYTQVSEGRICSNGGNRNSIGIESAVNEGSDLWYTWQITAQLVADIMVRNELDITKVKGHHFFSAKNCPQPMLENDLEIWREFIELVKAEYERITTCENYKFAFECDSDLVNEHGRVTGQKANAQVVTYKVTITKGGKTETVELASIIQGTYNK